MTASWTKTLRSLSVAGLAAALAFTPALMGSANATPVRPWMNTALTPEQRADKLLKAMTFSQKVHMTHGKKIFKGDEAVPGIGWIPPIPELGIPQFVQSDGPAGVRNGDDLATKFPSPIAYAASWDPAIPYLQGRVAGEEARALGTDQLYGPGFNLARNPLGGRGFEYYGEDPYLSGMMAAANVKGIQSNKVIATLKHYVANNQEMLRNFGSSNVPERALNEIYMKPFQIAIAESNPGSVMCSYNQINGQHGCGSYYNLMTSLRHRMGFKGYVGSDHPAAWSPTDLKNGLNVEMPFNGMTREPFVRAAIDAGKMTEKDVDDRVRETLTVMFRFGLFDRDHKTRPVNVNRGYQAAKKVAQKGAVLLKNKNNALPLSTASSKTIAVIGNPATDTKAVTGDPLRAFADQFGSSATKAIRQDNALAEITKRAKGSKVTYNDSHDTIGAVANAKKADTALVFVAQSSAEAFDNETIQLSQSDQDLIDAVSKVNKRTIVVIYTGYPVAMPWLDKVEGVLNMWEPGEAGGAAVASLLFGDVNPSGRLPQTFPAADGQWPANTFSQFPGDGFGMNVNYTEGIWIGYRWYQKQNVRPLFPFGYGLSYTTFEYSAPRLVAASGSKNAPVKVSFTVTNTGKRAGSSAAQIYVGKPKAGLPVPVKELGAYKMVHLKPGESKTVTVTIDPLQLSVWNDQLNKFVVKPGVYKIYIGQNVDNTPLFLTYTVR